MPPPDRHSRGVDPVPDTLRAARNGRSGARHLSASSVVCFSWVDQTFADLIKPPTVVAVQRRGSNRCVDRGHCEQRRDHEHDPFCHVSPPPVTTRGRNGMTGSPPPPPGPPMI